MGESAVGDEGLHGCLDLPPCADDWLTARPERRDAAEHRQRILDVARDLFDRCGVDAISIGVSTSRKPFSIRNARMAVMMRLRATKI